VSWSCAEYKNLVMMKRGKESWFIEIKRIQVILQAMK